MDLVIAGDQETNEVLGGSEEGVADLEDEGSSESLGAQGHQGLGEVQLDVIEFLEVVLLVVLELESP